MPAGIGARRGRRSRRRSVPPRWSRSCSTGWCPRPPCRRRSRISNDRRARPGTNAPIRFRPADEINHAGHVVVHRQDRAGADRKIRHQTRRGDQRRRRARVGRRLLDHQVQAASSRSTAATGARKSPWETESAASPFWVGSAFCSVSSVSLTSITQHGHRYSVRRRGRAGRHHDTDGQSVSSGEHHFGIHRSGIEGGCPGCRHGQGRRHPVSEQGIGKSAPLQEHPPPPHTTERRQAARPAI